MMYFKTRDKGRQRPRGRCTCLDCGGPETRRAGDDRGQDERFWRHDHAQEIAEAGSGYDGDSWWEDWWYALDEGRFNGYGGRHLNKLSMERQLRIQSKMEEAARVRTSTPV